MAIQQPTVQLPFTTSHAFIIGINDYQHVSPLSTAVNDASKIAEQLANQHHFQVYPPLLDASHEDIRKLLSETIPQLVGEDDRVLFYFAGHGIALDGEDGPNGYLVAADTKPGQEATLVPMMDLHDALTTLPCRHGLLILDCCFSGAFKWSSGFRDVIFDMPKVIYEERFWRYCKDPAWQVITSAAHDQKAVDIITNQSLGLREDKVGDHSPFAHSLMQALNGAGDVIPAGKGDGVITATELYSYLRDSVETTVNADSKKQSPSIFNLQRHDKGEFIFLNPNHRFNLPPTPDRNPFMGLSSYNENDANLFYGRDRVVSALLEKIKHQPLIIVSGASGTGKSSVIKAGVLPQLRTQGYHILPIIRPGKEPLETIATELPDIGQHLAVGTTVLVIDQYEELITQCLKEEDRLAFEQQIANWLNQYPNLRILLSIRSDFEPQFESEILAQWWQAGRYVVPSFSLEEIREVITKPAAQAVLFYEPDDLVEQLSEEVSQAPGALPLLSFTLSELYHKYLKSGREDRGLTESDYHELGGVIGALRTRADAEYQSLPPEEQSSMRKLMLRMVSLEGGELAGKRVYAEELHFMSAAESARLRSIASKLVNARLLLQGTDGQGRAYIEPAHDALVRAWGRLWEWIKTVGEEKITLQYKLSLAVNDYYALLSTAPKKARNLLWNNNPRLDLLQAELAGKDHGLNAQEETFVRNSIQRRSVRKRTAWAIAAAVMIGLAGLSVYALLQRNEAQDQTVIAQEQTKKAEAQTIIAEAQTEIAEQKTIEAQDSATSAQNERLIALAQTAEAVRQTGIARNERDRANQKAREATAGALVVQARALAEDDPTIAYNLVYEAFQLFPQREAATTFNFVNNRSRSFYQKRKVRGQYVESINTASLQKGGKYLLSNYNDYDIQYVDIMDVTTGSIRSSQFPRGHFFCDSTSVIDQQGKFIYSLSHTGVMRYNIEDQSVVQIIDDYGANESAMAIAPDGTYLLIQNYNQNNDGIIIQQWDISSQPASLIQSFNGFTGKVSQIEIAPQGDAFLATTWDAEIVYWKTGQSTPLTTFKTENNTVNSLSFTPDGQSFFSGTTDGIIQQWEVKNANSTGQTKVPLGAINALVFSNDGQRFLSCSNDAQIRLWSLNDLSQPIRTYSLNKGEVAKMAFFSSTEEEIYGIGYSPILMQGASDIQTYVRGTGTVSTTIWSVNSAEALYTNHNLTHRGISLLPSGQEYITINESKVVLRSFEKSEPNYIFSIEPDASATAMSAMGDFMAIRSKDGSIGLWSMQTKKLIHRFQTSGQSIEELIISPDGRYLAGTSQNETVQLWLIANKQQPSLILQIQNGINYSLDFSADSKQLLVAGSTSDGCDANIYDTSSGRNLKCIEAGETEGLPSMYWNYDQKMEALLDAELGIPAKKSVESYSFKHLVLSPDNKYYAGIINTGSAIDSLKIWDYTTGRVVRVFDGNHGVYMSDVAYSPDGRFLISCGYDEYVRMWHIESGELIRTFEHRGAYNSQIGFSQDGTYLFSNSEGEVLLWKNPLHNWDDRIYRLNEGELSNYRPKL